MEAGMKSQALGGALTLNLAAYSTVVHDFQANVVDNAAVVALRSYLANIPRVTVRGWADANGRWRTGFRCVVRSPMPMGAMRPIRRGHARSN
jgi:iron complex outermembrane receptor protein